MKTQHCSECKHSTYITREKPVLRGNSISYQAEMSEHFCDKGHKPRFYKPKYEYGLDDSFGYKRKCADFESV